MSNLIAIVVLGGFFIWIATLFYKDAKINKEGVLLNAKVLNMESVSSNENGSSNIRYKLLVEFPDGQRIVESKNTISTFYAGQLEPGKEVKIKYLNDDNIRFVFRE